MANGESIKFHGPMLAHGFKERLMHEAAKTYAVQPKLDGMRCLAFIKDGDVVLMSRGRKRFLHMKHIEEAVRPLLLRNPGAVYDGELYLHGTPFQTLCSMIKREQENNSLVEYVIYDMFYPDRDLIYAERKKILELLDPHTGPVKLIQTRYASSLAVLKGHHQDFCSEGYEGSIIRDLNSVYECDKRSHGLMKYKSWLDSEFVVLQVREGYGKFEGCGIFVCAEKLSDGTYGKSFDCVMNAPLEELKTYWASPQEYVGRLLTVKYFERSLDGVPRFPRGLRFREEE